MKPVSLPYLAGHLLLTLPPALSYQLAVPCLGQVHRIHRCSFRGHANSSCKAQLQETVHQHGNGTLEPIRDEAHADHRVSNKTRGLGKLLKATVT